MHRLATEHTEKRNSQTVKR